MTKRNARRAWTAALRRHVRPGKLVRVEFRHDAWCLIYSPAKTCTCNPDRVLMSEDGAQLACVTGVGPYDPLELVEVAP